MLYALVQHELKRLLAFSTIENVGIVALGLGASLVLAERGAATWSAIAFAAALLHVANHAVFKALLFLGAGAFDARRRARSSSTASAACCGGCRGPAGRSCSAARRSPGCRR